MFIVIFLGSYSSLVKFFLSYLNKMADRIQDGRKTMWKWQYLDRCDSSDGASAVDARIPATLASKNRWNSDGPMVEGPRADHGPSSRRSISTAGVASNYRHQLISIRQNVPRFQCKRVRWTRRAACHSPATWSSTVSGWTGEDPRPIVTSNFRDATPQQQGAEGSGTMDGSVRRRTRSSWPWGWIRRISPPPMVITHGVRVNLVLQFVSVPESQPHSQEFEVGCFKMCWGD